MCKDKEPEKYIIHLLCTNCNHKWEESIPKGMEFYTKGFQQRAGYGFDSWEARDNQVNCPNCECNTVRSENWDETNKRLSDTSGMQGDSEIGS